MKIYLGIDIGSKEHVLYFIDREARETSQKMKITNDREGFSKLKERLYQLEEKYQDLTFKVGMEATGSYWRNIFSLLKRLGEELDIEVTLINPDQIHEFKKIDLIRVKTDSVDARSIARYLRTFKPDSTPLMNSRLQALRKLCRFRRSRVKEQVRIKNQLDKLLAVYFPEYNDLFGDIASVSSLTLLMEYPGPKRLRETKLEELADLRYGKINHRLGKDKAYRIKEAVKQTVGDEPQREAELTLKFMAKELLQVKRNVEELKKEIEESYEQLQPDQLHTVDGIASLSGAIISTEVGDINRFYTAGKLNGYVGAYPELKESGKKRLKKPQMTKKGNKYLREAIFMATMCAIRENRIIRRHYQKQLEKGKEKMVAIGSCMRKMVHLIYGILKSGKPFDPYYEEKKEERGAEIREEKPEPQAELCPASERSSNFSSVNYRQLTESCQPRMDFP